MTHFVSVELEAADLRHGMQLSGLMADARLGVLTVPASTFDSPFRMHSAYRTLPDALGSVEPIRFSQPQPTWAPVENALSWASLVLSEQELLDAARVSVGAESEAAAAMAAVNFQIQSGILRAVLEESGAAFDRREGAITFYNSLVTEQLFATHNSPWKLRDAARFGSAVAPGALTLASDESTMSVFGHGLAGIFVVYVVIPGLRGFGQGLETVMRDWAHTLGPRRRSGPPEA